MVVALLLLLAAPLAAQPSAYYLELEASDQDAAFLKKKLKYEPRHLDSLSLYQSLQRLLLQLHGQAYLTASVDSLVRKDSITKAYLTIGPTYRWVDLDTRGVDKAFLNQVGYNEKSFEGKAFDYLALRKLQEALLEYAENNGYPFASVGLEAVAIEEDRISARLLMNKHKLVTLEGINIIGEVKITPAYLKNYLGLREGELYSKDKIKKVRARIRELPFLKEKRDVTVTFKGDKAVVNLFLERKRASRWDFIIGILPNSDQSGRLRLTGSFTGELHNQFGLGEQFFIDFQRLRPGIQELDLRFSYPYVLNLPFGLDLRFAQYRRDSTYRDITADLGVQYLLEGGNFLRASWNSYSTTLLNIDLDQITRNRRLPDNLDIRNTSVGLEYQFQRLDYRFNPRRGWSLWLKGATGNKRIKPNGNILSLEDESDPTFDFASLYDTLDLNSFQYRLDANLAVYLPFLKRNTIKLGAQGGMIFSEQEIFQNEQYRLGGNRLLRGFDEESIFATRYAVFTLEYRFLIGQNSYLYAFGDYAYLEDIIANRRRFDNPLGLGLGMTFEVKVGVFGISLAVGRTRELPFNFRDVKTHLGYVSYF
ncbi:MAG: BamA/TamA family outer membrane protein [Bacteroidota bacterium]